MNSSSPPTKNVGTYANGAGPTTSAAPYAAAHTRPGSLDREPMLCAICVADNE